MLAYFFLRFSKSLAPGIVLDYGSTALIFMYVSHPLSNHITLMGYKYHYEESIQFLSTKLKSHKKQHSYIFFFKKKKSVCVHAWRPYRQSRLAGQRASGTQLAPHPHFWDCKHYSIIHSFSPGFWESNSHEIEAHCLSLL